MTITSYEQTIHPIRRATTLTIIVALLFWVFFQLSKLDILRAVSPFADDPVDAIGSIAVQLALAVGVLTLARTVPYGNGTATLFQKGQLIVRGDLLVCGAVATSLCADTLTMIQQPLWRTSVWGYVLAGGLGVVALSVLLASIATVRAARRLSLLRQPIPIAPGATAGALSDALADLWALLVYPVAWLPDHLAWMRYPLQWMRQVHDATVDIWTRNLTWADPRSHPWRFCFLGGLTAGVLLGLVHVFEDGMPANVVVACLIMLIFIVVEVAAALLGFLTLGGILGLRPALRLAGKRRG